MKNKKKYIYLSIIYYWGLLEEHMMAFWFNFKYLVKNKRLPPRATKEDIQNFITYLESMKEKDKPTK